MKIQKPAQLIPKGSWYNEFSNCKSENVYEITYKNSDSGEVVTNKVTNVDLDENSKTDW